jgi:hypothetical protein
MTDGIPFETESTARDPAQTLGQLQGPHELHAAVLALLLPAQSQRARRAYAQEAAALPSADELLHDIDALPPGRRLGWLEQMLQRMAGQSADSRRALMESARRVMGARGTVRAIDRLYWLVMRQRLGAPPRFGGGTSVDLAALPAAEAAHLAAFTAHLARIVPDDAEDKPGHAAWYADAMAPWCEGRELPAWHAPDSEALVHAVQWLQSLTLMQRPVLVRQWVDAAKRHSEHRRLLPGAADALRLTCTLLDSPMPPALEQHYATQPKA